MELFLKFSHYIIHINSTSFHEKNTHNKLGTKVMYLHIIKSIYDRPTGYDIFSIETL